MNLKSLDSLYHGYHSKYTMQQLQICFLKLFMSLTANFLISIGGIYACFSTWGVLQESLTTKSYDGAKFNHFTFLNLIQSLFAALVGIAYTKLNGLPLLFYKDFFVVALSSSLASPVGYFSLKYINYPVFSINIDIFTRKEL